jgi:general secretion pathway protein H
MLALAIISLLAVLSLPSARFWTGPGLQRYEAERIATLLRADRNAALRAGRSSVTILDLARRRMISGESSADITISSALTLAVQPGDLRRIEFTADGRSNGGRLLLGTRGNGVGVWINPQTAAVQIEEF